MTPKGRKDVAKRPWRQQKRGAWIPPPRADRPDLGAGELADYGFFPELVAATDAGGGGRYRGPAGRDLDPPEARIDGGRDCRDGVGCAGVRTPAARDRRAVMGRRMSR